MVSIASTQDGIDLLLRTDLEIDSTVTLWADGGRIRGPHSEPTILWKRHKLTGMHSAIYGLPNLRHIHSDHVGLEDLPLDLIRERNIIVTVPGTAYARGMAEWIVLAMLSSAKRLEEYHAAHDNNWTPSTSGEETLRNTTAAFFGAGSIYQHARPILAALSVRRAAQSPSAMDWGYWCSAVLPNARWVILAAPLTKDTRHKITAQVLDRCNGATLINVGRNDLVEPLAIQKALNSGSLRSAVLDVEDPPIELRTHSSVLLLPHITWRYRGVTAAQVADFASEVRSPHPRDLTAGY